MINTDNRHTDNGSGIYAIKFARWQHSAVERDLVTVILALGAAVSFVFRSL